MTKDEQKALVDEHLEPMMRELGIPHWRGDVFYSHEASSPDGVGFQALMRCSAKPQYERFSITIFVLPCQELSEDEFLSHLRHELLHVVGSTMYDVFAFCMEALTEHHHGTFQEVWDACEERTVRNLERMYAGIKG